MQTPAGGDYCTLSTSVNRCLGGSVAAFAARRPMTALAALFAPGGAGALARQAAADGLMQKRGCRRSMSGAGNRLAIGPAGQQAVLQLAVGVKLARQHPSDHKQQHDDDERDERSASAAVSVAVVTICHAGYLASSASRTKALFFLIFLDFVISPMRLRPQPIWPAQGAGGVKAIVPHAFSGGLGAAGQPAHAQAALTQNLILVSPQGFEPWTP